jgi:cytoskeletal protein RodZ
MKKEKIKIVIIVIIVIIVCVILLGIGILFASKHKSNKTIENNTNEQEQVNDVVENTTSNMYEEHCLNNFCVVVNSFKLNDDESEGVISFTITNKNRKTIEGGLKKIKLEYGDESEEMFFSYFSLDVDENLDIEITFNNTNLINATDYELLEPTSEESSIYSND